MYTYILIIETFTDTATLNIILVCVYCRIVFCLRPGHNCEEVELEVAFHALSPNLETGELCEMLRMRTDLRMRSAAAVVLLSRGIFGVAIARVLRPIEREAGPWNAHLGKIHGRGCHEVGFERRSAVRLMPCHVLSAEGHLKTRVLHRGRLHTNHQRAVDERRNVGVNGLLSRFQRCGNLAEAGRFEKRYDGTGACKVSHASTHVECRVRLPAHHRIVHILPGLGHRFFAVEGHQNVFSGESRRDYGAKEEYGSQHFLALGLES